MENAGERPIHKSRAGAFSLREIESEEVPRGGRKGKAGKDTRPKDTWNKQSAVKNTGGLRERGKKTEYRAKNHVEEHRLLAAYHRASRRARKCHVVILVPVGKKHTQLGGAQSVEKI